MQGTEIILIFAKLIREGGCIMDMTMEIKCLKMGVVEELMDIDSPEVLKKIKLYIGKLRKQNNMNCTTRKALEEMEQGEMVHFKSFDDYVKATENA